MWSALAILVFGFVNVHARNINRVPFENIDTLRWLEKIDGKLNISDETGIELKNLSIRKLKLNLSSRSRESDY